MKKLYLLIYAMLPLIVYAYDSTQTKEIVPQQIIYKTNQASEMYLVWAMNNWKVPEKKFQPAGTYVKDGMAYTKMEGVKDSFFVNLQLPPGIYIDFMFWATKDSLGQEADGWDNNWGTNYNYYIRNKPEIK